MPPRRKKQNSAIMYDPSAPIQTQIESLHRAIEQVMGQSRKNDTYISNQKSGGGGGGGVGNGHTTPMPDVSGGNTDHDNRYLKVHALITEDGLNVTDDDGNLIVIDNRT